MLSHKAASALSVSAIRHLGASSVALSRIASLYSYSFPRSGEDSAHFPGVATQTAKTVSNRPPRISHYTPSNCRWMSTHVTRDSFEGDFARDLLSDEFHCTFKFVMESVPFIPLDVDVDAKKDPLIDTWNRMKSAATAKIVKAVAKQIDRFKHNSTVRILDAGPSAYASIAIDVASRDPHTCVVVTSESAGVLEKIREDAVRHALSSVKVHTHDECLEGFQDSSFDIVVCSFGQAFLNSPRDTLQEFHRVLKPEGSLVVSISDNFAMEHLFHFILDEMLASGNLEDFTYLESDSPIYFNKFVEPHSFEKLIADGGFDLAHVDHEVARIILTDASYKDDIEGFTVEELAKNGKTRKAMEGAKRAFVELTKDPSLVSRDTCGNLVTSLPRQFKIMTATRQSELISRETNA